MKIGHDVQGGAGDSSGLINANGTLAAVDIGGSLLGGAGIVHDLVGGSIGGWLLAGVVNADGTTLGPVSIAHNVRGGVGGFSGRLSGNTGVSSVSIAGSVLGGAGLSSAQIFTSSGNVGAVRIGHNLAGGAGAESGKIDSAGQLASLVNAGSLLGGSGDPDTFLRARGHERTFGFGARQIGRFTGGGRFHPAHLRRAPRHLCRPRSRAGL